MILPKQIQEALTNIEELPIALEQLNNDEGVSQIILDTEDEQINGVIEIVEEQELSPM